MAIGFPAYHEETARFRGQDREKLRQAAEEALAEIGWRFRRDGRWRLVANVPMGFYIIFLTWGARLTVEVEKGGLALRSEGVFVLEWLDIGQHKANINKFLDRLEDILDEEAD